MSETPQQELERLRKEDDERKRNAAAAQSQGQAQSQGSGFSFSDLWSWIPSIGTILMGLALVTGVYFALRSETVQNWIGETFGEDWKKTVQDFLADGEGLLGKVAGAVGLGGYVNRYAANMPVADVQEKLRKNGAPDAVVAALAGDESTWKANVDAIQAEGGNVADPISATNIYAMLTRRPQTVQAMAAAIKPGATMTEAQKAFAQKLSGAMGDLVKSDKLDALLTTHRDTVLPLLLQFSPVPINGAMFSTALQRLAFGPDGKVTDAFRNLMSGLLQQTGDVNADNTARMAALQTFIVEGKIDGATLKLLANSIDISNMENSSLKTMLAQAQQATPQALQAQAQLAVGPVPVPVLQQLQELAAKDPVKLVDRLMNDAGLRQGIIDGEYVTKLGQLLQAKHDASRDPAERAQLSVLIMHPRNQPQNYINLNAMFTLVDELANNPRNIAPNGLIGKQPGNVLHGIMGVINAKSAPEQQAAFAKLNTNEMVWFFRNPANSAAFSKFFAHFNTQYLPPDVRAKVDVLRNHFDALVVENGKVNTDQSTGFAEILADPKAVAFLLEQMKQPQQQQTQQSEGWTRFKMGSASWIGGWFGVPDLGTLPENSDAVIAIMKATGQIAPGNTPAQQIIRSRNRMGTLG